MCTAATYRTRDLYFGRTLDYDLSYGEEVTVTPRRYPFRSRGKEATGPHYAMIGMAHVEDGYPLYYDAVNEKGLGMAGLNFAVSAVCNEPVPGRDNVETFAFIPWILGHCATVEEARSKLERLNLTGEAFRAGNCLSLSPRPPRNHFSSKLELALYSRGMGALGLPGGLSSQSRSVRAAFVRLNSVSGDPEEESVGQFFHILNSVDQQRGCCELGPGVYEYTIYTSCCNTDRGIYYYTTYGNHQISAVDLHKVDLNGTELVRYPLTAVEQIRSQN